MPAVDRPAGRRPAHAARDAEHGADQHRLAAGLGRVDERLGPARVEEVAVGAEAPVLGVQVPDGVVARRAPREVRVEAARLRRLDVTPARRRRAGALEQLASRPPAGRASRARGRGTGAGGRRARDASRERARSAPAPACTTCAGGRAGSAAGTQASASRTGDRAEPRRSSPSRAFSVSATYLHKVEASSGRRPRLLQCRNAGVAQW